MKLKSTFLIVLFFIAFSFPVNAATSQFINDNASLLTEEQSKNLEQLAAQLSAETETAIMILTTNTMNGLSIKDYMGNFYDNNDLGYTENDGNVVLFTIDMGSRELYLAGFHKGEEYVTNGRIDSLLDKVTPYISSGDYYNGFKLYIEESAYYLQNKPVNILHKLWLSVVAALFIGLMVVVGMVANRGGRVTVTEGTYNDPQHSGIVNGNDRYITTHITKVKRPKNNSGGGGGRTGGGTSFSGGGRSF